MFWSYFKAKSFCLQALLWNGLLFFGSRCDDIGAKSELLIIGTPDIQEVSTITITTTIAYNPTPTPPGDLAYTLRGCYRPPSEGLIFGPDGHDTCSDTVPPNDLTIEACLKGCASLAPRDKKAERYAFAGLRNGSECVCGRQISPGARNLPADDCKTPCAGDPKLSCGGSDAIAVYNLGSADTNNVDDDDDDDEEEAGGSGSLDKDKDKDKNTDERKTGSGSDSEPTTTSAGVATRSLSSTSSDPESATTTISDHRGHHMTTASPPTAAAAGKAAGPSFPSSGPTSAPPLGAPPPPASAPTIAAITGSFSGAIILAVVLVLCVRARRRKKKVKVVLERKEKHIHQEQRQPVPSPIRATGAAGDERRRSRDRSRSGERGRERGREEDERRGGEDGVGDRDLRHTVLGDFLPTTPVLESGGGKYDYSYRPYPGAGGLHSRTNTMTTAARPSPGSDRDSLYGTLLDEVRSGPAAPAAGVGLGLGIATRTGDDAAASSSVQWRGAADTTATPPNSAISTPSSMTNPYPYPYPSNNNHSKSDLHAPALAARIETLGDRAWHRRKISTPYQPVPAAKSSSTVDQARDQSRKASGLSARGQTTSSSGPPPNVPLPPTPTRGAGGGGKPVRPRRSLDTIRSSGLEQQQQRGEYDTMGVGVASTTYSSHPPSPYSPTPQPLRPHRRPTDPAVAITPPPPTAYEESPVLGGGQAWRPGAPVLPPIVASGSGFRWEGMGYDYDYVEKGEGVEGVGTPSTVGTSILFPEDDEEEEEEEREGRNPQRR